MVDFSYPAVVRISIWAARYWHEIDGEAAARGVDLLDLEPRRWLAAVLVWIRAHLDKDGLERFNAELYDPLPGASPDSVDPSVADAEMQAFKRLSQEVG